MTNLSLNPDTTYYIVVDGYNSGASGNYQLNVRVGAGMHIFSDSFETDELSGFHAKDAGHAHCVARADSDAGEPNPDSQKPHSPPSAM